MIIVQSPTGFVVMPIVTHKNNLPNKMPKIIQLENFLRAIIYASKITFANIFKRSFFIFYVWKKFGINNLTPITVTNNLGKLLRWLDTLSNKYKIIFYNFYKKHLVNIDEHRKRSRMVKNLARLFHSFTNTKIPERKSTENGFPISAFVRQSIALHPLATLVVSFSLFNWYLDISRNKY